MKLKKLLTIFLCTAIITGVTPVGILADDFEQPEAAGTAGDFIPETGAIADNTESADFVPAAGAIADDSADFADPALPEAAGSDEFSAAGAESIEDGIITISNIDTSQLSGASAPSSTEIEASGIPADGIDIISEEWSCPEEFVFEQDNVVIKGGRYSYKLVIRSNRTLTFDNDLEIVYQGVNGKYRLHYDIDEKDNHIMTVTGQFDNIIISSPLMEDLPAEAKKWILSHISEDSYLYELVLKTQEGFSFINTLRFLFDESEYGYSLDYNYDLKQDKQTLVIKTIPDCGQTEPEKPDEIVRAKNKITDVTSSKTVKSGKKQTFTIAASVKENAKKTFSLESVPKKANKYITVSKSGKVTVKKGLKKGTYTIRVRITAGQTEHYRKTSVTKSIKIKVK